VSLRRTVEVNSVEGLMMNFDVVPLLTKGSASFTLTVTTVSGGSIRYSYAPRP
jgi:hypothetical protein